MSFQNVCEARLIKIRGGGKKSECLENKAIYGISDHLVIIQHRILTLKKYDYSFNNVHV